MLSSFIIPLDSQPKMSTASTDGSISQQGKEEVSGLRWGW